MAAYQNRLLFEHNVKALDFCFLFSHGQDVWIVVSSVHTNRWVIVDFLENFQLHFLHSKIVRIEDEKSKFPLNFQLTSEKTINWLMTSGKLAPAGTNNFNKQR